MDAPSVRYKPFTRVPVGYHILALIVEIKADDYPGPRMGDIDRPENILQTRERNALGCGKAGFYLGAGQIGAETELEDWIRCPGIVDQLKFRLATHYKVVNVTHELFLSGRQDEGPVFAGIPIDRCVGRTLLHEI